MVRGVGAIAFSVLLVSACTTFGTMESPSDEDAGTAPGNPTSPLPTVPPPGPSLDGSLPPGPHEDGGPATLDGSPLSDATVPPREAGTGDRRIALVSMVAPTTNGIRNACSALGPGFAPFVARNGMLPSAQYAPDNRRIVQYSAPTVVIASSLAALQTSGASTAIVFADGGRPSEATRVWTGLGSDPTAVGETCGNWTNAGVNGGAGAYNQAGRATVYLEGKSCDSNNTLMAYCVEL